MTKTSDYAVLCRRFLLLVVLLTNTLIFTGCQKSPGKLPSISDPNAAVKSISDDQEFERIMQSSHQKLTVVDFYADWCGPCQELAPQLEKVARQMGESAQFYKINIDEHRSLSMKHGVTGIPYVAFFKNGDKVHALMGVWPPKSYIETVNRFSFSAPAPSEKTQPSQTGRQ